MIPIQMELGGKDACIVCHDADIDLAAKNIVKVCYQSLNIDVLSSFPCVPSSISSVAIERLCLSTHASLCCLLDKLMDATFGHPAFRSHKLSCAAWPTVPVGVCPESIEAVLVEILPVAIVLLHILSSKTT